MKGGSKSFVTEAVRLKITLVKKKRPLEFEYEYDFWAMFPYLNLPHNKIP